MNIIHVLMWGKNASDYKRASMRQGDSKSPLPELHFKICLKSLLIF